MLIINTGGTFNKRYDRINGKLYVPKDDIAILNIMSHFDIKYDLQGIIYKDSLDILDSDRNIILETISKSKSKEIIIIHGTDTINETALLLASKKIPKNIILTGAMVPYEIDNIEATINIAMCFGFLKSDIKNGIYICMSGVIDNYNRVIKNKQKGIFERINY